MIKQQRVSLDEIQLARAFAIIAVLVVHSTSSGVTSIPTDSVLFPIYNFFNIAGKLGTPTFIMLSSFVLFYNYFPRETNTQLIKNFYLKRLKYIIIPYFIFSLIYFGLKWMFYYDYPSLEVAFTKFIYLFVLGKAHPHLYFVFISFQLYLMFPVIMLLLKKYDIIRKHSLWIGVIIQWIWVYLNKEYFHLTMKGSISLSYFSFYFVGAYLGIYYDVIRRKMKDHVFRFKVICTIFFVYGGLVILYTGYMYLVRIGVYNDVSTFLPKWINSYIGEFAWSTHALFAGIGLFLIAHWANVRFNDKTKQLFMEIGATSFGIYLIHPLLLMMLRLVNQNGSTLIYSIWQVATFILISIGSWMLVRLTQKLFLENYWIIFGKLPPMAGKGK